VAVNGAGNASRIQGVDEENAVKILKIQAFRVLLALSALASAAMVLEAGRRW
jgi:hypothetical protein